MKLFGFEIAKAPRKENIPAKAQFRPNAAQGWMTAWFQDYCLRKVSGEFYEVLREGIPIIDSAIRRLISLNGTIKIIGDNMSMVKELEDFCLNVPVNDTQKGIHAFLENASNETFEQGFSLSEFIATPDMKDIAGLRVADSKNIIFRRNADGKAEPWYRYPGFQPVRTYSNPQSIVQQILTASYGQVVYVAGLYEEKLNPENKLYFSINNENTDPYGVSIMRSMEFVSKILMTMQNSLLNVWERFGDPSYKVLYKTSKKDTGELEKRRSQISTDFKAAVKAKREGRSADFVAAVDLNSDLTIEVIGHDNQVLDMTVPVRHVLEQIVSKTNLPAWMLGVYWSTTERMATIEVESVLQDAKIRQLAMLPEFIRLFSTFLRLRGRKWRSITTDPNRPGDWGIVFETPNLRDMVAQAQARFLNAQADMMQDGVTANSTQTSVNVGGASVEVAGMKFPIQPCPHHPHTTPCPAHGPEKAGGTCLCGQVKELHRPTPWPELDQVESDYENGLKADWGELGEDILNILGLSQEKGAIAKKKEPEPPLLPETAGLQFTGRQRSSIMNSLGNLVGKYDWQNPASPVRWYYGQAYSLGLIKAAKLVGAERPILDIIRNQQTVEQLYEAGFELVKDNATKAIVDKIIPEIEAQVVAGENPRHVAARLKKIFGDKNSDWERLARSEMSMAAEQAKLDEWKEWEIEMVEFTPAPDACSICVALAGDYKTEQCPVPVRDTHPYCRCSIQPAAE